ncbi:hypothetical protein ACQ4PT_046246 [Festuca glaucescens]
MVPSSQIILSPRKQRDRVSDLPDGVLGHVLSFLPTPEAGRAAVLCRRWRYIFGHVHTVSYEEQEGERSNDWDTFYHVAKERKSCSGKLLDAINVALLCRRRCAVGIDQVPLRSFWFAFDNIMPGWDARHQWRCQEFNSWLTYVLQYAGREAQDLQLDLRFLLGPICARDSPRFNYGWSGAHGPRSAIADKNSFETDSDSDEDHEMGSYRLPGRLFSCAALKTLCLGYCQLKLPTEVNLPCLETLRLTGILTDSGRSVQRLVQSCPRLQDLTLEAVRHLRTLSVLHRRLRCFALRCCHNAKSVQIDASELVSLEYRGAVPAESLLTLHGSPPQKYSCAVDICTPVTKNVAEHAAFRKFLGSFSGTQRLHLHHGRLHRKCLSSGGLPLFPCVTRLVLQGRVESLGFVGVLRRILEQTPNLEVLTLYMAEQTQRRDQASVSGDGRRGRDNAAVVVPCEASFAKPCLRLRVKVINMVHYEGNETQRTLARLLLSNAIVLEEMCVVFIPERFAVQAGLKKEIVGWARDCSKKIFM